LNVTRVSISVTVRVRVRVRVRFRVRVRVRVRRTAGGSSRVHVVHAHHGRAAARQGIGRVVVAASRACTCRGWLHLRVPNARNGRRMIAGEIGTAANVLAPAHRGYHCCEAAQQSNNKCA